MIWLCRILFFCLPLFPNLFVAGTAMLSGYALLLKRRTLGNIKPWLIVIVIYAGLGSISQLLTPMHLTPDLPRETTPHATATNLLRLTMLTDLHSWSPEGQHLARYLGEGFWRVDRFNPETGLEYQEIATFAVVPVQPNTTYSLSFYIRATTPSPQFLINFITKNGYKPVEPTFSTVQNGLQRAYAQYTTKSDEVEMRGLNLIGFSGNWAYLEIGYPQLEKGNIPSAYNLHVKDTGSKWLGMLWWLGTAGLGFLLLLGGQILLQHLHHHQIGLAVLLGLGAHLTYALITYWQDPGVFTDRALGLTVHPNFLGQTGVTAALLVWVIAVQGLGSIGIVLALGFSLISGSRASLIGTLVFIVVWWLGFARKNRALFIILGISFLIIGLLASSYYSGRLVTLFDSQFFSNQTRLQVWAVAREAFKEFPLAGVGFNRFATYYYINAPTGTLEPTVSHTHNLFLNLAAEGGGLALAGFFTLWSYGIWRLTKARQFSSVVAVIIVVLMNLVDFTFFTPIVYSTLYLLLVRLETPKSD